MVKRAFAPILATFKQTKDRVELWIVNDTLMNYQDTITFRCATFAGEMLYDKELRVSVPPNSARIIARINNPLGYSPSSEYLFVYSHTNNFPDNRLFFGEIKDLQRPTPRFNIEKKVTSASEIELRLSSQQFIYFCKIECPYDGTRFSDNYFDLFPNRPMIVRVRNIAGHSLSPDDVTVSSLE